MATVVRHTKMWSRCPTASVDDEPAWRAVSDFLQLDEMRRYIQRNRVGLFAGSTWSVHVTGYGKGGDGHGVVRC